MKKATLACVLKDFGDFGGCCLVWIFLGTNLEDNLYNID